MMHLGIVLVLILADVTTTRTAEDEALIELGGLRQARALLTTRSEEYVVKVSLRPVLSFDRATNDRISRDLARQSALQALARHFSGGKAVEMTVSGARVTLAEGDGKVYRLTLIVPRAGVILGPTRAPATAQDGKETIVLDTAFFTRKRDYLTTLQRLVAALRDETPTPPGRSAKRTATEAFELAIAAIEERARTCLEKLAAEVKQDSFLLFTEKDELTRAIGDAAKSFVDHLSRIVREHNAKQEIRNGR